MILAGGQGTRFGGPKAFARLPDQRTFLEACCEVLTGAGARPVAATLPPGFTADGVPGLRPIPLPCAGLDMLGSLRWGLRHLISDRAWGGVVVLPVDHPLVSVESVTSLKGADAPVAIPSYRGKHGHPIVLRRDVAEGIAREELDGETLRDIIRASGSVDVPVNDPGVVANCNTPDALRQALETLNPEP
jgi:molybdenum cofactor cytidylyltransferase/nicotine blue oxidoreductase